MKFKIFYQFGSLSADDTYKLPDHSIAPYILSSITQFVNVCNGEIIDKIRFKNSAVFPIFDVIYTILQVIVSNFSGMGRNMLSMGLLSLWIWHSAGAFS